MFRVQPTSLLFKRSTCVRVSARFSDKNGLALLHQQPDNVRVDLRVESMQARRLLNAIDSIIWVRMSLRPCDSQQRLAYCGNVSSPAELACCRFSASPLCHPQPGRRLRLHQIMPCKYRLIFAAILAARLCLLHATCRHLLTCSCGILCRYSGKVCVHAQNLNGKQNFPLHRFIQTAH